MAMKRAMKAAAKKGGTGAMKAMRATKTKKAKTATTPKAMKHAKAQEDPHIFVKKWDGIYHEFVKGVPFTWRLEDVIYNKRTGKVAEHWRWGPA